MHQTTGGCEASQPSSLSQRLKSSDAESHADVTSPHHSRLYVPTSLYAFIRWFIRSCSLWLLRMHQMQPVATNVPVAWYCQPVCLVMCLHPAYTSEQIEGPVDGDPRNIISDGSLDVPIDLIWLFQPTLFTYSVCIVRVLPFADSRLTRLFMAWWNEFLSFRLSHTKWWW